MKVAVSIQSGRPTMAKVVLDDGLRAKLDVGQSMTEVCDQSGQTLGYFVTPEQFRKLLYAWAHTQFTDEEADRAWNDYLRNGGVSTQEALERAKLGRQSGETAA
jgi:hypothetical protein